MKIQQNKERIKQILMSVPESKDNDNLLLSILWQEDMENRTINSYEEPITTFLDLLAKGSITNFESVRRTRQKLQEHNKSLRGTKYPERQYLSVEVSKEISTSSFEEIVQDKYEQITPEILATLKEGQDVYFTHPEPTVKHHMPTHFANDNFILGAKYEIIVLF